MSTIESQTVIKGLVRDLGILGIFESVLLLPWYFQFPSYFLIKGVLKPCLFDPTHFQIKVLLLFS